MQQKLTDVTKTLYFILDNIQYDLDNKIVIEQQVFFLCENKKDLYIT